MSSLGYSDFSSGGGGGGGPGDAPKRGSANAGDDGYIAAKRKNKTVKSFDTAASTTSTTESTTSQQLPFNPKLERLKQSIAKIHMAAGSDDDDADADAADGGSRTNMLPSYPGQGWDKVQASLHPHCRCGSGLSGLSGPGLTTGSGSQPLPPTTAEGRTHQPMFSLSQQSAARTMSGSGGVEHFGMKMPSTYAAQYYKQFVPYNRMSNELSSAGTNSDELIEKLNYIVHMLEEQHNERTEHVAEELVLYCFLGVFIIFIVDSFARAGKYTR